MAPAGTRHAFDAKHAARNHETLRSVDRPGSMIRGRPATRPAESIARMSTTRRSLKRTRRPTSRPRSRWTPTTRPDDGDETIRCHPTIATTPKSRHRPSSHGGGVHALLEMLDERLHLRGLRAGSSDKTTCTGSRESPSRAARARACARVALRCSQTRGAADAEPGSGDGVQDIEVGDEEPRRHLELRDSSPRASRRCVAFGPARRPGNRAASDPR